MAWTNAWCALYYGLYLFLLRPAEGRGALSFLAAHPAAAWDLAVFCGCAAVGQSFIFLTIAHFGSLVNTMITTSRKACLCRGQGAVSVATDTVSRTSPSPYHPLPLHCPPSQNLPAQFFAILLSAVWHSHDISAAQWAAVAAVFVGLLGAVAAEQARRRRKLAAAADDESAKKAH